MVTKIPVTLLAAGVALMAPAVMYATQYDVAVEEAITPVASPKLNQSVSFKIINKGEMPLENFIAGANRNGKKIGEKMYSLATPLNQGESMIVTLDQTVELEYDFTDEIELYTILTDAIDDDSSNNKLSYDLKMPWLMEFPYTWTDEEAPHDFDWPSPWTYDPTRGTFTFVGSKPSLNTPLTSGVFDLGKGGDIKCSLVYNSSDIVRFTLCSYDGDEEIELSSVDMPGNGGSYSECNLYGQASGYVQFKLKVSWPERPTSYAVLNLSNIDFKYDSVDVRACAVLSPTVKSIAVGSNVKVKASFENLSSAEVKNPTFCYSIGSTVVKEVYEGELKGQEVLEYEFKAPLAAAAGTSGFNVWCEVEGDANSSNDRVQSGDIVFYTPFQFPFKTEFDDAAENALWNIIDTDGKGWMWQFGTLDDGNNILGFPSSYGTYDDYAVSPGISLPAGTSRLSFYHSGVSGGTHLTVLAGTTPDVNSMTETLFDEDINQYGWRQGYGLIQVPEAGIYYLAFYITGAHDQLLIDKLSVDNEEDISIGKVAFDTKSGFNLSTANVSIGLSNHGLSPQSDIKVGYQLNDGEMIIETHAGTLQPGESAVHTFASPVDISVADTNYKLAGKILTEVGSDRYNDAAVSETLYHYKNIELPYYCDFSDVFRASQWTMSSSVPEAFWSINISDEDFLNTNGNYEGIGSIKCTNKGYKEFEAWAFSECVEIPAGTYELSFFYRTAPQWSMDSYSKDFSVKLGTAPTAESMNIEACAFEKVLEPDGYVKYIGKVTVSEDGKYYIGLQSSGKNKNGFIQLDALSIKPEDKPLALPWAADFVNCADEWYHYNPTIMTIQWIADDAGEGLGAHRDTGSDYNNDGMVVTPLLEFKAGEEIKLQLTYSLEADNKDVMLDVYTADINHPDNFTLLTSYGVTDVDTNEEYTFDASDVDRALYLGFRTRHNYDSFHTEANGYTAKLKNVAVLGADVSALNSIGGEAAGLRRNGNMLVASDASAIISIYTVSGMQVGSDQGEISVEQFKGTYIVTVETASGKKPYVMLF